MPSVNTAASPGPSVTRNRFWAGVMFIVAPTVSRSPAAGSRWVIFTAVFLMTSPSRRSGIRSVRMTPSP